MLLPVFPPFPLNPHTRLSKFPIQLHTPATPSHQHHPSHLSCLSLRPSHPLDTHGGAARAAARASIASSSSSSSIAAAVRHGPRQQPVDAGPLLAPVRGPRALLPGPGAAAAPAAGRRWRGHAGDHLDRGPAGEGGAAGARAAGHGRVRRGVHGRAQPRQCEPLQVRPAPTAPAPRPLSLCLVNGELWLLR